MILEKYAIENSENIRKIEILIKDRNINNTGSWTL